MQSFIPKKVILFLFLQSKADWHSRIAAEERVPDQSLEKK